MPFFPNPTLIGGDGALAAGIWSRLRRNGLAVRLLPTADLTARRLRRADTLILADPEDPAAVVAQVLALCASRHRRRPALRLILAQRGAMPRGLPADLPSDLPGSPEWARAQVEGFALEAQAARALLAAHPMHAGLDPLYGQVPHLLIAGAAPPALALLAQALRLGHYTEASPVFTLAADDPDAWRGLALAAFPKAELSGTLRFTGLPDPDLLGAPPVTGVWVFVDPPETGLDVARRLTTVLRERQGGSPPIYLDVGDTVPLGRIEHWDGQIVPVSWLAAACTALLGGSGDELAQVIHDHYRDTTEAQGRDPAGEPAGRPWELLDTSYRDASRHQADHLWAKLAASDCRAVPLEEAPAFAFAPLEVERLAEVEHRRWAADRHLNGWTYAPVRDNALRHHPQLVPYADLSEPMKDLDRYVVRLIPTLLARSGRALVRSLVLGLGPQVQTARADRRTRRLVDTCLGRLCERYPDRGLVLATTLGDPLSRLVAKRALEGFDAALWLLCPGPLPDLLAAQPDMAARRELLGLVERAERRIALAGETGLADWLARRAQILMLCCEAPAPMAPAKQVRLDPARKALTWGFEY
jgi:hypothetical protein